MAGMAQALLERQTGIKAEVAAWPGEVAEMERPTSKKKEAPDLDEE
jgi:hypothetical protein